MHAEQGGAKKAYRAKLYALTKDSTWEDSGTGHVSVVAAEGSGDGAPSRRLVFREEETGKVLHDRPIFVGKGIYSLQGEGERNTIITWEDPESGKDWALSFQEMSGTEHVWEAISAAPTVKEVPKPKSLLPLPHMDNLCQLSRLLTAVPPSQRGALATECLAPEFFQALCDAFHRAEDEGSEEALSWLWRIVKGIFLLSNQKLTERCMRQDVFEDIMGILEYDEGLPLEKRIFHRQVLQLNVRFNAVVALEDTEMLERIHLYFRLMYVKDIALPRVADDSSLASMTQVAQANLAVILDYVQKNPALLEQVLAKLREKDLQSLAFLQELCRHARVIPPSQRNALHERLVERGLFGTLTAILCDGGSSMCCRSGFQHPPRHVVVEILQVISFTDASPLRKFLTEENNAEGRILLSALIRLLHEEEDQGVQSQISELFKAVLEPSTVERRENASCMDVFYDRGALDELVAPLRPGGVVDALLQPYTRDEEEEGSPSDGAGDSAPSQHKRRRTIVATSVWFGLQLVCELLAFLVVRHGHRAKIFIVGRGIAQQVGRMMSAPQRFVQLAPVRLLRVAVGTKDEAYHSYVAKSGLFAPLMRNFEQNLRFPGLGGNAFISATLELLEFILRENVRILVDHLCRRHGAVLREHEKRFKTFEGLLQRQQQNLEEIKAAARPEPSAEDAAVEAGTDRGASAAPAAEVKASEGASTPSPMAPKAESGTSTLGDGASPMDGNGSLAPCGLAKAAVAVESEKVPPSVALRSLRDLRADNGSSGGISPSSAGRASASASSREPPAEQASDTANGNAPASSSSGPKDRGANGTSRTAASLAEDAASPAEAIDSLQEAPLPDASPDKLDEGQALHEDSLPSADEDDERLGDELTGAALREALSGCAEELEETEEAEMAEVGDESAAEADVEDEPDYDPFSEAPAAHVVAETLAAAIAQEAAADEVTEEAAVGEMRPADSEAEPGTSPADDDAGVDAGEAQVAVEDSLEETDHAYMDSASGDLVTLSVAAEPCSPADDTPQTYMPETYAVEGGQVVSDVGVDICLNHFAKRLKSAA